MTSQIALPEDACTAVYATSGYEQSVPNLAQTSLATDMVFADGYSTQLGTVTGSARLRMTVSLNVGRLGASTGPRRCRQAHPLT